MNRIIYNKNNIRFSIGIRREGKEREEWIIFKKYKRFSLKSSIEFASSDKSFII